MTLTKQNLTLSHKRLPTIDIMVCTFMNAALLNNKIRKNSALANANETLLNLRSLQKH